MSNLTEDQIVDVDLHFNHVGVDRKEAEKAWRNACSNPSVNIVRHGESLMVVACLGSGKGRFHFINAAPYKEFVENVVICLEKAKLLGFKEICTYFINPRIIDVARDAKVDFSTVFDNEEYHMIVRL